MGRRDGFELPVHNVATVRADFAKPFENGRVQVKADAVSRFGLRS